MRFRHSGVLPGQGGRPASNAPARGWWPGYTFPTFPFNNFTWNSGLGFGFTFPTFTFCELFGGFTFPIFTVCTCGGGLGVTFTI